MYGALSCTRFASAVTNVITSPECIEARAAGLSASTCEAQRAAVIFHFAQSTCVSPQD